MIGMSNFAGGGFWNPRAKGPLNIQAPPMQAGSGMVPPPSSPIGASNDMLQQQMGMPQAGAGMAMPRPSSPPGAMTSNRIASIFGNLKNKQPRAGGMMGGAARGASLFRGML